MKFVEYPKIQHTYNKDFEVSSEDMVDVEEKIDGSQISFGVLDGELSMYSKGARVKLEPKGMFSKAVTTALELQSLLRPDFVYRGEYVQKPRHNVLVYDRAPNKFIILFDVMQPDGSYMTHEMKVAEAARIGLEMVPLLYSGPYRKDALDNLLDTLSILGGQKVEGVVIKPHSRSAIGKHVSVNFKELITGKRQTPKVPRESIIDALISELATEARWQKAVIHLQEQDALTGSKKDIGPLLKEAGKDMHTECESYVKDRLFAWAWPQIAKGALRSLPEWYQSQLEKQKEEACETLTHS